MGATTRWKDTQTKNFEEALQKLTSQILDDERTNSIYWKNFTTRKILEEDKFILLNGTQVKYNIVKFGYDQMSAQEDPSEDRQMRKNGCITIYEHAGAVYYIVDQNSTAKKLLRKMLGYAGKNEIEEANFDFKEDFFVWLVNRVYNSESIIENSSGEENKVLQLEEIKGIRGNTEDLQTKVTTSGESVMNVISTLSFMLESRRLNQVVLNLQYTGHENILVKLQKSKMSTVEFLRPYLGGYVGDTNEEISSQVYMLLYFEILPLLEQEYRINKDEGEWNQETYVEFLTGIKETVIERIEEKIQSLQKKD